MRNYVLIGQQKGKMFVQKVNLPNAFCLLVHNLKCRGLLLFPDLHTEVWRSWEKPVSYRVYSTQASHYSSIYKKKKKKKKEHGYGEMPKV